MGMPVGIGRVKLSDGTIIKLKTLIVDVKEAGFSPFGGVSFDVKVIGGVATESVPNDVKELVKDKPLAPLEPPKDGWEILDITEQQPAEVVENTSTSLGIFSIKVVSEVVMASRNVMYRTPTNEPLYWVSWVNKVSWRPLEKA